MTGRPWTEADTRTLKCLHAQGLTAREVGRRMGRVKSMIRSHARDAGIVFVPKHHRWTPAQIQLVHEQYPNTPTKEVARALGVPDFVVYRKARLLGLSKTAEYLASPAACRLRRGDHIGAAYQFKKGQVPPNKGLRRPGWSPGRMAETQFRKGQRGNKWVPIGSTRINADGYLDRKIRDTPRSLENWRAEHVLLWEEHLGPLPPGHCICFKNGDKRDVRIDNLVCISRAERMRRNTIHRYPEELKDAMRLVGRVKRQYRKRNEEQDRGPSKSSVRRARRSAGSGEEVRPGAHEGSGVGVADHHR